MGAIGSSLTNTTTTVVMGGSNTVKTIFNITIATANTEQSQTLPANCKGYIIKTRGNGTLKLTHTATESGTTFLTIPPRAVHSDTNFYTGDTVYFQCDKAGEIVELVTFS